MEEQTHSARKRTKDVQVEENIDFSGLLLSPPILKGLTEAGYLKPSPIQLKAIPLGRFGVDLIAQAKSGTGKTCVFSVIALESISIPVHEVQAIIVAPTREIALQIKDVVTTIGKDMPGLCCHAFVGGLPMATDLQNARDCHIAVGTPGRLGALLECGAIKINALKMLILDEADKLYDENLQDQTNFIFKCLPKQKQVLAFSATFPPSLLKSLSSHMKDPQHITLIADKLSLEGVKQYYSIIPQEGPAFKFFAAKVKLLLDILSKVAFHQCLVFSNDRRRAQQLAEMLTSHGWPAAFIAGGQPQEQRMKAMEDLRNFQLRVLVSTDLTSRGIDIERINLVVNMDIPRDLETYLHRIGRTGRFGTYGVAVTFVSLKEHPTLKKMAEEAKTVMEELPEDIPKEYYAYDLSDDHEKENLAALESQREKALLTLPTTTPEEVFRENEKIQEQKRKDTTKEQKSKEKTTRTKQKTNRSARKETQQKKRKKEKEEDTQATMQNTNMADHAQQTTHQPMYSPYWAYPQHNPINMGYHPPYPPSYGWYSGPPTVTAPPYNSHYPPIPSAEAEGSTSEESEDEEDSSSSSESCSEQDSDSDEEMQTPTPPQPWAPPAYSYPYATHPFYGNAAQSNMWAQQHYPHPYPYYY